MWAINSILEIIFPEREDHKIIRKTSINEIKRCYQPHTHENWTALTSLQQPEIRAAIHETKFHHNNRAVELLAEILKNYLVTLTEPMTLIPIPLSKVRLRERGYNQVTAVAKVALKNHSNIILNDKVLLKPINTKPQTSLDKNARLQNVTGVYELDSRISKEIIGQNIILLDDVVTTGATLKEAHKLLLTQHPKSITCIALAH